MDLKEIFEHKIKIESKVKSIDALFMNKERVEHTNYHPYYQRNYVWDEEKATYFIESIFLGTEIPPLIFFVNDEEYEVIDGRQRYETITRFMAGKMNLRKSALRKLSSVKELAGKGYNNLTVDYQDLFLDTKIRVIEFGFLSSEHSCEEEEQVKREIFQRYNSGITPLNQQQIDKAIYYSDDIVTCFKEHFAEDKRTFDLVNDLFGFENPDIEKLMRKIRELLVLRNIPIKYYAISKQDIVSTFFEYLSNTVDSGVVYSSFIRIVNKVDEVVRALRKRNVQTNRLVSECLYWALSIIDLEYGDLKKMNNFVVEHLIDYIEDNIKNYQTVRSSFANEVNKRYETTAIFFERILDMDFNMYLCSSNQFKARKDKLNIITSPENLTFEDLRINKPEPTSFEIGDICRQMERQKFLLRPPYQRDEVIDKKKASAIIESLLLGIKLPPVFVFKHKDGLSEVVDGQQRLLSIIGFIGKPYKDENGKDCISKKDRFKLQLKHGILKEFDGKRFEDLNSLEQRKLMSTDLWVIEINEKINPEFDPIDLFVRLNNKPYPIKKDTFEMWNSFVSRNIIETIKLIYNKNSKWFYIRKNNSRMENENLVTTLAYFNYMEAKNGLDESGLWPAKTIDLYVNGGKISCRMKGKYEITKVLEGDDNNDINHQLFIRVANLLDFNFISNLSCICSMNSEELNSNLDYMIKGANGRRTLQNFYILWLILRGISKTVIEQNLLWASKEVYSIVGLMSDGTNLDEFKERIKVFRKKLVVYESSTPFVSIKQIADYKINEPKSQIYIDLVTDIDKPYVAYLDGLHKLENKNFVGIYKVRHGFHLKYISTILMSRYFKYKTYGEKGLLMSKFADFEIPYLTISEQEIFVKVYDYISESIGSFNMCNFFYRMIDVMVEQLYLSDEFEKYNIRMIENVLLLEKLPKNDQQYKALEDIYVKCNDSNSPILANMLKAIDVENMIYGI